MTISHKALMLTVAAVLLAAFSMPAAIAQPAPNDAPDVDQELHDDVLKLLQVSGAEAMAEQMWQQMMANFREMLPNVPDEFWDGMEAEMDLGALLVALVPAYTENLTHQDILDLIDFYESDLGQRLVAAQPQIAADSMLIGQAWGEQIGQRVVEKLEEQ